VATLSATAAAERWRRTARWRRQLGGCAVAAATSRRQLGGDSLAAAAWRHQLGDSGGGGSSVAALSARAAAAWRRQLGGGSLAVARRRWRGGSGNLAATAWRR
jgi:hypothetical protein